MVNVDIEKVVDVEKLRHTLDTLTVNPLTIRPMAVHLKELNQVAPLSVVKSVCTDPGAAAYASPARIV